MEQNMYCVYKWEENKMWQYMNEYVKLILICSKMNIITSKMRNIDIIRKSITLYEVRNDKWWALITCISRDIKFYLNCKKKWIKNKCKKVCHSKNYDWFIVKN